MAKSILDVEVNARDFEKFAEQFDKYQDALSQMPGDWERAAEAQKKMANEFNKMNEAIDKQIKFNAAGDENYKERIRSTRESESLWASMARSSQAMSKNVLDIGTGLLKWGSLIGGGLLFGSIWGIDRLANSMSDTRSAAMGYGVRPSAMQALHTNFSNVMDTQGFLSSMTEMENDPAKAKAWYSMMPGQAMSGDTMKDAMAFLSSVRGFAKEHQSDHMLGTLANAYGLPFDVETLNRMAKTSDPEWAAMNRQYGRDSGAYGLTDSTTKTWQDLSKQFERTATMLKDRFAIALEKIAPDLEHLAVATSHLISSFLGSKEVKKALDDLAIWIGGIAKGIDEKALTGATSGFREIVDSVVLGLKGLDIALAGWKDIYLLFHAESIHEDTLREKYYSPEAQTRFTLEHLARQDQDAGFNPNTLEFLFAHGLATEDDAKRKWWLEMKKYGNATDALAALYVGEPILDDVKKTYGRDWFQHADVKTKELVQGFRNATGYDTDSTYAPQGTGVTVTINNQTGGNTNTTVTGLGAH